MISATGRAHDSRQGFSLVEVLVAVVILSTGIVAVLYSFNASVSALAAARDGMRTDMILRQKTDDVLCRGLPPTSGGTFSGSDSEFSWHVVTVPSGAPSTPGLNDVIVSVRRGEYGEQRQLVARMRLDRNKTP